MGNFVCRLREVVTNPDRSKTTVLPELSVMAKEIYTSHTCTPTVRILQEAIVAASEAWGQSKDFDDRNKTDLHYQRGLFEADS
jgi:hypothetical protein